MSTTLRSLLVRSALPFAFAVSSTAGCGGCGNGNSGASTSGNDGGNGGDGSVSPPVEASLDAPSDTVVADGPSLGDADGSVSIPLAPGGSGAFGVVTVGGKQKVYLPSPVPSPNGHGVIAVVDVGVAGNGVAGAPALIANIDLGTASGATTTGGDATAIVAGAVGSRDLWFIDPTTDMVVDHQMLDSSFGQASFSYGGGFVNGIAVDSTTHRAILAVWNGFALVDLATRTITTVVQAPPSENFGFDSVHGLVYAPFYDCKYANDPAAPPDASPPAACGIPMTPGDASTVMTDGLSVIRLSDDAVFTYEDPSAPDPAQPVGGEPDSAGADPTTQLVVVSSEGGGFETVLDFSQAVFDTASHTVTAPRHVLPNLAYDGVAADSTSHLAFLEQEANPVIAVFDLQGANAGSQSWVGATMPNLPGGGTFLNLGDPHGIAVTASILGAKPVGLLVDNTWHWVARVDLQTLASLAQPDASSTADASSTDAAVTYLDITTHE